MYLYIAVILYFIVSTFLPLLFWCSKRNTSFFGILPFTFIAYFIGAPYFTHLAHEQLGVDDDIETLYTLLLLMGTLLNIFFYTFGFLNKGRLYRFIRNIIGGDVDIDKVTHRGRWLALFAVVCFGISFYVMDMIPLFADNPMTAKYMAGEYHEAYVPIAPLYRMAMIFANMAIILLGVRLASKIRFVDIVIIITLIAVLALTLRRSAISGGIISILFSYFACKSNVKFGIFFVSYMMIYCFGAAANDLFLYFMDLSSEIDITAILRGAPDVYDQLFFLTSWVYGKYDFTYGLTLLGGLVPYNFEYNLSAYTLSVIGAKAGETGSGGFRLLQPMIGYVNFGWVGVVALTSLSAYISGTVLSIKKSILCDIPQKQYIFYNSFYIAFVLGVVESLTSGIIIDSLVGGGLALYLIKRS